MRETMVVDRRRRWWSIGEDDGEEIDLRERRSVKRGGGVFLRVLNREEADERDGGRETSEFFLGLGCR
jgi:hypothetical protein